MIISYRHRFIFVKTKKTAGTSIEIMLSQFCGPADVVTPIQPDDEALRAERGYPGPQNCEIPLKQFGLKDWARLALTGRRPDRFETHQPAIRIRDAVGRGTWNKSFTFCFERNPWDRVISSWYYTQSSLSLHDYIMSDSLRRRSNWDSYADGNSIIVDHVARYENLHAELSTICGHLGLDWDGTMPRAKAGFRKDRRPYWEVLGPDERDRIAEVFAREIDHFGYTFLPVREEQITEPQRM